MNSNEVLELELYRKLNSFDNLNDKFAALERTMTALGFEHLSFTYAPDIVLSESANLSPIFKLSSEYREDFIDHYSEKKFAKDDFTIKRILNGEINPMIWWDEAKKGRLSNKEKKVIRVAREDFGLNHGISIPTLTTPGSTAAVSVISSEPQRLFEMLIRERLGILQRISLAFSQNVVPNPQIASFFYSPFVNSLNSTQKTVLLGLSRGKTVREIAEENEFSYKHLSNNVISELKRKFGCSSREQFMYKAGLIRFDQLIE